MPEAKRPESSAGRRHRREGRRLGSGAVAPPFTKTLHARTARQPTRPLMRRMGHIVEPIKRASPNREALRKHQRLGLLRATRRPRHGCMLAYDHCEGRYAPTSRRAGMEQLTRPRPCCCRSRPGGTAGSLASPKRIFKLQAANGQLCDAWRHPRSGPALHLAPFSCRNKVVRLPFDNSEPWYTTLYLTPTTLPPPAAPQRRPGPLPPAS